MNLKKNPIEKYFFIMEKNDFEKKSQKKIEKSWFFQLKNWFFQVKFLLEKIDFSIEKIEISRIFFEIFFKIIFLHDEKIFFDGIFLKVQLLVKENRLEAVPERYRQFKDKKNDLEVKCTKKTLYYGNSWRHAQIQWPPAKILTSSVAA